MNQENISQQAAEVKGQTEDKTSGLMDKAGSVAQSAKESVQEAGGQVQAKAHDATDAVKNAVGMNK